MLDVNHQTLRELIHIACPKDSAGKPSITRFSALLGVSYQAVYQWCNENTVPAARIPQMIEVSEKYGDRKLTFEEISPFSSAKRFDFDIL